MRKIRILDLDNCISDDSWRICRINWDNPDKFLRYVAYHQLAAFDAIANVDLFKETDERIIISTARPEAFRPMTEFWLRAKGVPFDRMLMRETNDFRPSVEVKESHLNDLYRSGIAYNEIGSAFDDHYQIVAMYKHKFGINSVLRRIHHISAYRGAEA